MSMFKYIAFSLLLSVPVISGATTTALFAPFQGSSSADLNPISITGTGSDYSVVRTLGSFTDIWTLTVGDTDVANIDFQNVNSIGVLEDNDFKLLDLGSSGFLSLTPGEYTFLVGGNATGTSGGLYTTAVAITAVPLPAAVWLFGSALLGWLSMAKRKHQI